MEDTPTKKDKGKDKVEPSLSEQRSAEEAAKQNNTLEGETDAASTTVAAKPFLPRKQAERPSSVTDGSATTTLKEQTQKHLQLVDSTRELFNNTAEYLQGELLVTSNDYKLLERMNQVMAGKYHTMTQQAAQLVAHMEEQQKRYESFTPYLQHIDEVSESVEELEKTVKLMDEYTKQLEAKFYKLKVQQREKEREEKRKLKAAK
ncbi:biogenesis of lysosome-related organelles complex 1 subunit 2 [Balamuthia mandrillaris]